MAQYRDPATGQFATPPVAVGASDAAIEAMKTFSKSIGAFTKAAKEKVTPAARAVGSAALAGAVGTGKIINQRRKDAGLTQESLNDKFLGNHPILHAIAGGSMDMMNMAGRGVKAGAKALLPKKKAEAEATKSTGIGKALGGGKSTEDKRENRAILESIKENVQKIADASTGSGDGGAPEPAKKGGMLGLLAGVGGMAAGIFNMGTIKAVFSAIGGVFTKLVGIAKAIPAMVTKMMPWIKKGAKFFKQIFKKLFWPVTALLSVFSFVDGFIEGFKDEEDGGLVEGFKRGIESLFNNLIDAPLNMLKDVVAWIAGALGFENIEESLNSFDFDIGGMLADGFQILIDFFSDIPDMIKGLVIDMIKAVGGEKIAGWFGIDVDKMQSEIDERKKAKEEKRTARDKRTEERRKAKKLKEEESESGVEKAPKAGKGKAGKKHKKLMTPDIVTMIEEGKSKEEIYLEFMKGESWPNGDYIDDDTGLSFLDYDDFDMAETKFK